MFQKKCPNCNGFSYSSIHRGKWQCPYCKADLSIKRKRIHHINPKLPIHHLKLVSK